MSSPRILTVVDDGIIRMTLVDMLEDQRHRFVEAGSGEDAFAQFDTDRFDLLVADLGLPGMFGQDLAEWLRQMKPDLPVIVATGMDAAPILVGTAIRRS